MREFRLAWALCLVATLIAGIHLHPLGRFDRLQAQVGEMHHQLNELHNTVDAMAAELGQMRQETKRLQLVLSGAERFEVTAYAPLDPNAIAGMCFEGDPNVTASGERPIPGVTAAAGRAIPFGTRIWVEGEGVRIVNDRGGMIHDRAIDLVKATRGEALRFGRQWRRVAILGREED